MAQQPPPVRRVVTENDASGRAFLIEDTLAPSVKTVAARPKLPCHQFMGDARQPGADQRA